MKKIILVDGNSLMFRSYYATSYTGNLMRNKDGLYTNALFGFCNMVNKLLERDEEYIFIAFDAGKQTFRHQQYHEYKGTRRALPDELRVQIPYVKQFVDIIGVKRMETLEYEADDLIASMANYLAPSFDQITIISGDKDLLQLVNDKVTVCLTKKGVGELEEYNELNFKEKMGILPSQITDYKGLVGDSSDNLPGIKGVGEKTAIKLLNEYSTLEGIYENINALSPKMQTLFSENKDIALKCKHLATLIKEVEVEYNEEELKIKEPNLNELIPFYKQMDFTHMLKRIKQEEKVRESNYIIIDDDQPLELHHDSFIIGEVFGSNYHSGEFLGIGIINDKKEYFITPNALKVNKQIKEYLENESEKKYTFDLKQLYFTLAKMNIFIKGVAFDLLLANYLIDPATTSDDFKRVSENFHNQDITYYENIYGSNSKMVIPDKAIYSKYAVDKCSILENIKDEVLQKIEELDLTYLFQEEMKLSIVLAKIEEAGLLIDLERLKAIGKDLQEKAENVAQDIYFIAGKEFNINSPKQLGEILFEELKLPHGKKNKTGYATGIEVLEKLAKEYVIARDVLKYRAYNKLVTTYVNGLQEIENNGYIHPLYKQALTSTGRLSSIEPNIQNMPIRTEVGQVIREVFISRFPNGFILSLDYSQIELRVLAHMSGDMKMIEAFNDNVDFHRLTASNLFDVRLDEVTDQMRRTAKAINFGIIYGMSAWGLSEQIAITPSQATQYIDKYFYTYHQAKQCLDNFINEAKTNGYTKTLFNRRRYIPEINNPNANLRNFGERTAMNSPIQGSAADIIKIAMNLVSDRMEKEKMKSLMIAQVHDELLFDCCSDEVDKMLQIVKEEMENAVKMKVPLLVSGSFGTNWYQAK